MDLQRIEASLSRLEGETANVAAVGAIRKNLEILNSTLNGTAESLKTLTQQLLNASASYEGTTESIQETLEALQGGLDKLAVDIDDRVTKQIDGATTQYATLLRSEVRNVARDVEERVRNQINSATTQYATLLRAEIQAIVDRMDLNHRDDRQFLEQGLTNLAAKLEAKSTQLEAKQRSHFKWLIVMMFVSAVAVASGVIVRLG